VLEGDDVDTNATMTSRFESTAHSDDHHAQPLDKIVWNVRLARLRGDSQCLQVLEGQDRDVKPAHDFDSDSYSQLKQPIYKARAGPDAN